MRFTAVLWLAVVSAAQAAEPQLLLQKPTLSRAQIAFVYAGDIWTVPRAGGDARRLTSGVGVETNPVFSPDGNTIAFTGEYDGNVDVYTIPSDGGVPKRLTYHPAPDTVLGWTPDGKRILFTSGRENYSRISNLYTVDTNGAFPEKLPLPWGWEGSYSPDASRIAYVPMARAFAAWKHYRGGMTTPIWLASLGTSSVEKIPHDNSNDYCPMWIGSKVYFLSDRNGPVALFSYDTASRDTASRKVKEELKNAGLDFKSASAGPGGIVIEQFGAISIFDTRTGKLDPVKIRIAGDLPEVRDRMVNVSTRLANPSLSPTGARAVFEARGEIVTVPAEKGDVRNITNTPGAAEHDPIWSPDGKTIAYFSDENGEYSLHLAPQSSTGAPDSKVVKITMPEPGTYRGAAWSPDSKNISFIDSRLRIWCLDVEKKKTTLVDKERFWNPGGDWIPVWSPDSKWLAYSKRLPNYLGAIHVWSLETGKATQVTDGLSDAKYPAFDKEGKYLYFAASTDAGPAIQPDVESSSRPVSRTLYLAVLTKDLPSPFAPESDEEKVVETPVPKPPTPPAAPPAAAPVKIDFDGIGQRILAMPLPSRNYVALETGKAGVLFAMERPVGGGGLGGVTVHRHDLKSRKSDVVTAGVQLFEVSKNGEKMLVRQGTSWSIRNIPPSPPAGNGPAAPAPPAAAGPGGPGQLNTSTIEVKVSPRAEWRQMFHEAWRVERDHVYDYHGLDLVAAEKRYEPFVDGIASRADLNYLFQEMLGNIVSSHLNVGGGDLPAATRVPTGLLGCDFKIENGRYRITKVYNGENWNPEARAPLTQPGVNVAVGDYLLAVEGRDLAPPTNVYSVFEGTANKQVHIRVGPDPSGTGSREVTVVPIVSDARLRNLDWIEGNRRKVDQATGGRVAYVYMPDTAFGGLTNFNRYFYAQVDKQAVIIDERFNGGGALATDIVEALNRRHMSSVATRDGEDEVQPQGAIFGPKVMIVNEFAGSGGDAMPWYFRRAGVGKLIGKRTWGGLIGRAGAPSLMDGGGVTAPSSAVWDPVESQYIAENLGVEPDIEVEHDPALVRQGHDPQLERAIQQVLSELEKNPAKKPARPKPVKYDTLR